MKYNYRKYEKVISLDNKEIGQKIEQTNDIIVIEQRDEDGKLFKYSIPSCKVIFVENDTLSLDIEYSEICNYAIC